MTIDAANADTTGRVPADPGYDPPPMTIQREELLAPAMHLTVIESGHIKPEVALDVPEEQVASAASC